ncbi:MAG: DNA repair protein RadC [Bacillus thermozeamaize]|uniref:DNA repair protein RadC n=1 Tax=Bacillus thermozeamaize TaxID=230954 RepID=A0A1Y3PD03_9BACI|nr:MAG: DNA repair protein RadC [Bacillus thermozeamaize]
MELVVREADLANLTEKNRQKARQLIEMLSQVMKNETPVRIQRPLDVYQLSLDLIPLSQEHFVVYFLSSKNRIIERKIISIGSLNATVVHPREVFREAILRSCAAIVCVHNHPSGDPAPSPEDIEVTRRLIEAGHIIGIDVLDHVIVGRDGYVSMKEGGLIA